MNDKVTEVSNQHARGLEILYNDALACDLLYNNIWCTVQYSLIVHFIYIEREPKIVQIYESIDLECHYTACHTISLC